MAADNKSKSRKAKDRTEYVIVHRRINGLEHDARNERCICEPVLVPDAFWPLTEEHLAQITTIVLH